MRPVVGIDPSLTGTAVATRDGITKIDPRALRGVPRVRHIRSLILDIIAATHAAPGTVFDDPLVVIEGYSFASPNQAHQIGELGFGIRDGLWVAGLEWIDCAPSALKKWATGSGSAKKDKVVSAVSARLGREFASNDHVDAWVLRDIGGGFLHGASELGAITVPRRAVLSTLTTTRRPTT